MFSSIHQALPDTALASLVYALAYVGVCWVPIYLFYRKNILLKI